MSLWSITLWCVFIHYGFCECPIKLCPVHFHSECAKKKRKNVTSKSKEGGSSRSSSSRISRGKIRIKTNKNNSCIPSPLRVIHVAHKNTHDIRAQEDWQRKKKSIINFCFSVCSFRQLGPHRQIDQIFIFIIRSANSHPDSFCRIFGGIFVDTFQVNDNEIVLFFSKHNIIIQFQCRFVELSCEREWKY